jgi:hypothetical protein
MADKCEHKSTSYHPSERITVCNDCGAAIDDYTRITAKDKAWSAPSATTEWIDCTDFPAPYEKQTRLIKAPGGAAIMEHRHRLLDIKRTDYGGGCIKWTLFSNKEWKGGLPVMMRAPKLKKDNDGII